MEQKFSEFREPDESLKYELGSTLVSSPLHVFPGTN